MYRAVSFPVWSQALFDLLVSRPSIRYYLQKAFEGPVDRGLEEYGWHSRHTVPGLAMCHPIL